MTSKALAETVLYVAATRIATFLWSEVVSRYAQPYLITCAFTGDAYRSTDLGVFIINFFTLGFRPPVRDISLLRAATTPFALRQAYPT